MSDETIKPFEGSDIDLGKSWEDLEKELGESEQELGELPLAEPTKNFFLSKKEIAEFAYNASVEFRDLVEQVQEAGEDVMVFSELSPEDQEEWTEVAGLALQMQGDDSEDNFARLVHAKTAMGLLKKGVSFHEKFGELESPFVAPWECLPHERRIPLLIFKAMCKQFYRIWDRDNEILKR